MEFYEDSKKAFFYFGSWNICRVLMKEQNLFWIKLKQFLYIPLLSTKRSNPFNYEKYFVSTAHDLNNFPIWYIKTGTHILLIHTFYTYSNKYLNTAY